MESGLVNLNLREDPNFKNEVPVDPDIEEYNRHAKENNFMTEGIDNDFYLENENDKNNIYMNNNNNNDKKIDVDELFE